MESRTILNFGLGFWVLGFRVFGFGVLGCRLRL